MTDLTERLAVLETKQATQEEHFQRMEKKVDAMYDVIMQLKGAKWLGWVIAAAFGFLVSNVHVLYNFLQGK